MDEPFAAVDAMTREVMQSELARIVSETGQAIVFITHSVDEAITLADRIAIVTNRPGQIRDIVSVDIPRPRGRESRKMPEFQHLRDHIWDLLSIPAPGEALTMATMAQVRAPGRTVGEIVMPHVKDTFRVLSAWLCSSASGSSRSWSSTPTRSSSRARARCGRRSSKPSRTGPSRRPLRASAWPLFAGMVLALVAVPIGLAIGLSPIADLITSPYLWGFFALPNVAFRSAADPDVRA